MHKFSTIYLLSVLTIISIVIVGIIAGCDEKKINSPMIGPSSGSGPVGGGDTQKIVLNASPSARQPVVEGEQGTVNIIARIENNIGQPMPDGTSVIWTSTVGTLDSTTTTTTDGSTTVTLTFPRSYTGCSTVTARSGDAEASITVCIDNVTPTPTATAPTPTPTATSTITPIPTATPLKTLTVGSYLPGGPPWTPDAVVSLAGATTRIIIACAATNGTGDQNLQITYTSTSNPSGVGNLSPSNDVTTTVADPSCTSGVTFTALAQGTFTIDATTTDGRSASAVIQVVP